MMERASTGERIDVLLDVACLFKTRSRPNARAAEARWTSTAIHAAEPDRATGDEIVITRGQDAVRP